MVVTRRLGCRYLWVDRFCIVQDDEEHKAVQLASMASIYANAYVTIMASDGDSDESGIIGVPGTESPRTIPFTFLDFALDSQFVTCRPTSHDVEKKYYTRGWIFQEQVISRRRLEFKDNTVVWTCKKITWKENSVKSSNPCRFGGTHLHRWVTSVLGEMELDTSWPDIRLYTRLVELYSTRELTNHADALNAFSAIIATTSRTMKGGILYGLPEMTFHGMLLWQPRWPLDRRRDRNGTVIKAFPSWSWIGWTGDKGVSLDIYRACHEYQNTPGRTNYPENQVNWLKFTPTIEWYKSDIRSEDKTAIQSTFYDYRNRPFGLGEEEHLRSILLEGVRFLHPVPIPSAPIPPGSIEWGLIITCRTRRLYLQIGESIPWSSLYAPSRLPAYLTDENENVVGMVQLNDLEGDDVAIDRSTECICIGAGESSVRSTIAQDMMPEVSYFHCNCPSSPGDNSNYRCCPSRRSPDCAIVEEKDKVYRFYHIMCIKWDNGIAYRVALGRVFQEFWDQAATEEIDVRLG